ncbi:uncharacterized protein LOC124288529 isoform X2 [Haliotis rubra]|uniref:uncharacterized protein LOC124288529 isoform X2 n=1 Tax=Haliotis rubra TaxID=36100 RepID=UPI001EE5011A|nr:uncharacterized protein LOC124288529 isoform X2 [Haliotis rubra]
MTKQRKGERKYSGCLNKREIARLRSQQTRLKDQRRETSMNLWIILIITWISISVVIADPKWFVHDYPLDGGDNEDLFSSEHLLPVQLKKQTNPKPDAPHIKPKPQALSHVTDTKVHKSPDKPKAKPKPKPAAKQEVNEIESENLIPVHKKPAYATGRKPLQAADDHKQRVDVKTVKTDKKPSHVSSPQILDEDEPCDPETDMDCLLETEELILVGKKKVVKPAATKKQSQPVIKNDLVEQMKKEDDIKPEVKKQTEVEKSALHRRLLQREGVKPVLPEKPVLQPLLEEVEEEVDEDALENEIYSNDQQAEEIIRRFKRQIQPDDVIGSGDGGGASFMPTTNTTEDPTFNMQFSTTLDKQHNQPLTPEEIANYIQTFTQQLNNIFGGINGSLEAVVRNIRLDENKRVTADWDLVVTLTGARSNTDNTQTQDLLDQLVRVGVPAINNMTINDEVVYSELNGLVVGEAAKLLLTDACKAENACPQEYTCIRDQASLTYCQHKCYSTGLFDQCQHGGACQINDNYEAYCQCGTGYSGSLCEQAPATQDPSYTTGQIVGAGVGAAVMIMATTASCIYIAFFRKKKEEDMDYSYFGDDDSSGPGAFNDADNALGISSYYIDRPSVSLTPLDIYHQTGTHA